MHIKHGKTLIVILIILALGVVVWESRQLTLSNVNVSQSRTATVFIPGYGGNQISTDAPIAHLNNYHIATKSLRIRVAKNGKVSTAREYHKPGKNNPLVQVLFANNKAPYDESKQMVGVMHYLYTKYHITHVNFIGHSSGGNIAYDYMVNHPNQKQAPKVDKFVTIGANYPHHDPHIDNLPHNLQILNIAGEILHTGTDGEVPVKIVKPMKSLVEGHVKSYKFVLYSSTPLRAEHSMLHENPQVDKIIADFLFK